MYNLHKWGLGLIQPALFIMSPPMSHRLTLCALIGVTLFALSSNAQTYNSSYNDGIHLAISPIRGKFNASATSVTNVNVGLAPLTSYKTIVSFGDSYTSGGYRNGSTLPPPVLNPPSPQAGGRVTDGRVWIEDISVDTGAVFMDYAVEGAVTNVSLWPSRAGASSFVQQANLFLSQNRSLDPETTLYTVFFGINDYSASLVDGDNLPEAAQSLLNEVQLLASPPTNARSFLVTDNYGRGNVTADGDAYKLQVYKGLGALHYGPPYLNFAFVDFAPIWNGVLGPDPGYEAFGYTSNGSCTRNSGTMLDDCSDPKHTFYWIPGHPSNETHRIMGDWVEQAVSTCIY